jgi:hypothetical protein
MAMMDTTPRDWQFGEFGGDRYAKLYYFEPYDEYGWPEEDGYRWYRLNCSYQFGDWIETQDDTLWEAYGRPHRAIYHVRGDLMTLIKLKWL